jgi:hypothetical protein
MAAVKTLRGLLNELRLASPNGTVKDSLATQYILDQYRKLQTTDEQLCKVKDEMHYLGQTYLCYLQSLRKYKAINADYKGAGERSVEDTARMVGFKLPHDPK